jgi:hypothetical protein
MSAFPYIPLTYAQITALLPANRYANNPILASNLSGSANNWFWSQIFDGQAMVNPANSSELLMYCTGMTPPVANGVQAVGLWKASASDPCTWSQSGITNPRLGPNANYWDNMTTVSGNRLGCVVYVSGVFYMYYTGNRSGSHNAIGLATSTDGVNFTRTGNSGTNLGMVLTASVDEANLEDPAVIYDNGTWYMMYAYRFPDGESTYISGRTLPAYRMAQSTDGINWTKVGGNGTVAAADVITHGGLNTWDGYHIEYHSLYKIADGYLLFYEAMGKDASGGQTLVGCSGFAFSSTPTGQYTKYSGNPVIWPPDYDPATNTKNVTLPYTWDFTDTVTPSLFYNNGQLYMFYCGGNNYTGNSGDYNFNHYDIGVALLGTWPTTTTTTPAPTTTTTTTTTTTAAGTTTGAGTTTPATTTTTTTEAPHGPLVFKRAGYKVSFFPTVGGILHIKTSQGVFTFAIGTTGSMKIKTSAGTKCLN